LDVNLEPIAAPTEAASRVDADLHDTKHIKADMEGIVVPAVDRPDKVEEPAAVATPVVVETRPSDTISLDETWNRYTNCQLGFSLKVPKTMVSYNGSCKWNGENATDPSAPNQRLSRSRSLRTWTACTFPALPAKLVQHLL
jgi:hypothetical protein